MKIYWGKRNKFTKKFLYQGKKLIVYNSNPCKVPKLDSMESIKVLAENREEAELKLKEIEKND